MPSPAFLVKLGQAAPNSKPIQTKKDSLNVNDGRMAKVVFDIRDECVHYLRETPAVAPRMQGCVVHRGIKTFGREPSWYRLSMEYLKALAPFFILR